MLAQCAADFHGRKDRYNRFIKAYEDRSPDVIFLAGDMGHAEPDIFESIEVPIYAVHGNIDGTLEHLRGKITFIDGKNIEYRGYMILGVGNTYPGRISERIDVILSHIPPFGIMDRAFFGMHIGSKWLREMVAESKPQYVICGHVHEDAGYEYIDDTCVINCSVGKRGTCTFVDFTHGTVEMVGYK
ncbi:MAG: hypothetical protein DRN21_00535 [Thermoplasmata archaeon]|nr:MAG: hypothetical protein FE046_01815 [Thermoplasmata archaeon]RLF41282.1 MAG: hypothetical protein DRN21_00535 [Thermoplasmata archaeon]